MAFPLTTEQRNIVTDRGGELLVSAAAGSGKTRVLVERLLDRVTGEGLDIDRFLVITYTKAAAAELRQRIAQELTDRLAENPGDRHLRRQTTLVYQAQISTIHAFCSVLLRENGYLLDLDPDFRLCDEIEGMVLMRQTLESVIDGRYAAMEPDSPFARLVDTLGAGRDDTRLVEIVLDIFRRVQSHADPAAWLLEQRHRWDLEGLTGIDETPWGQLLLEEMKRQAESYLRLLEETMPAVEKDELLSLNFWDSLTETIQSLTDFVGAEGWDAARDCLPIAFPRVGTKRTRKKELTPREEEQAEQTARQVKAIRERCKKTMEKVAGQIAGSSAELAEELAECAVPMQALVDLVLEFQDAFAAEKKRRALLDFGDLEHFAVKLLCDRDGQPTQLARSWSARYDEVLVDEYQDTNQVQNAIFTAISDGGRKLVQVGDVKQSIYRFRLADPTIFLKKYDTFRTGDGAREGQPRVRLLSKNFRSRPEVLEGCNDLFRALMSRRLGEMEYTDEHALVPGAAFPAGENYAVELNILDTKYEEEAGTTNAPGKDLLEARCAARRIRALLDGGFQVAEGTGLRPVRPSDIMVLLRSPGSVLHHYVRAFGEYGIPWSAEGGGEYFDTPEIHTALSILRLVDNPRQDVALIAALRSPVFGFTADELAYVRTKSDGEFYTALTRAADDGHAPSREFLARLEELRPGAGELTASQMIWQVYEKTNLPGIFAMMEHGEQRRENLLSLYQLARQMEETGCRTLFQFLLRLERLQESGGKIKTTGSGVEGDGVAIMSIHRSKGLEKPVVLVCGLTRKLNKSDLNNPVLFHPAAGMGPKGLDRARRVEYSTVARRAVAGVLEREMLSEELRLLYVALTRAREKLILTLALPGAEKTIRAFAGLTGERCDPELLAQQPSVGHWVLLHALSRPEAAKVDELRALGVKGIQGAFGRPWDIRCRWGEDYLYAPKRVLRGLVTGMRAKEELTEKLGKLGWQYPHAALANIPSKLTATQIKGRQLDSEIAQEAPKPVAAGSVYRPDFMVEQRGLTPAQKGTALHLAMEKLPLDGDLSPAGISRELDRLLEADILTPAQHACIPVEQLARFYASDLGREVRTAPLCRREFKFSMLVPAREYFPDGGEEELLLQGVVDLWFRDERGITVVDFKSDRVAPGGETAKAEEYRPQLTAYAKALRAILGEERLRTVLWFFRTGTAVELERF